MESQRLLTTRPLCFGGAINKSRSGEKTRCPCSWGVVWGSSWVSEDSTAGQHGVWTFSSPVSTSGGDTSGWRWGARRQSARWGLIREQCRAGLAQISDLRPGSLTARYRRSRTVSGSWLRPNPRDLTNRLPVDQRMIGNGIECNSRVTISLHHLPPGTAP
jgi:hypothetical protein